MTVLDHLLSVFRGAAIYNRHDLSQPSVILWTDGDRHWQKVSGLIAKARPGFFELDPAGEDEFRGPSTWIRYELGKWSGEETPVVYLPGIHRHQFRGMAGFPEDARHLYALQFQGQFCSQINGKDWTPNALLSGAEPGLSLRVGKDRATLEALAEQLGAVLQTQVGILQGKVLEASDFHELAVSDPVRLVLEWMSSPDRASEWPEGQWAAFSSYANKELGFDPKKDGVITAAERLVAAEGKWAGVWQRFEESVKAFPGVRKALDLVQPKDLFANSNPRIPATNKKQEDELRKSLLSLSAMNPAEARKTLAGLTGTHSARCKSVWARLDEAPLAMAADHLGKMLGAMDAGMPGVDHMALGDAYLNSGWKVDAEARKAWAVARKADDGAAVTSALVATYRPWLEELATRLQGFQGTYPAATPSLATDRRPTPGEVFLFVDGLRADIGAELLESLQKSSRIVNATPVWSALPTVTATAKPAWKPMTERLNGEQASAGFEPTVEKTGKVCTTQEFRKLLADLGWTWIDGAQCGDPAGCGWTEAGAFDRYGHDQGAKVAWRVQEEVAGILQRVNELMDAGWATVKIVTDHGWLWLPGGLPKVELPAHLTVSKWGRCALPDPQAAHGLPQTSWFWAGEKPVVLAPGIGVFKNGTEYSHGGLTLQEALTLCIEVKPGDAAGGEPATIESVKWAGLRLKIVVSPADSDLRADIRGKAADAASTKLSLGGTQADKGPDEEGRMTLLADDTYVGDAAVLVILRAGQVVAKQSITIGED
jgi:hypothetical protein